MPAPTTLYGIAGQLAAKLVSQREALDRIKAELEKAEPSLSLIESDLVIAREMAQDLADLLGE